LAVRWCGAAPGGRDQRGHQRPRGHDAGEHGPGQHATSAPSGASPPPRPGGRGGCRRPVRAPHVTGTEGDSKSRPDRRRSPPHEAAARASRTSREPLSWAASSTRHPGAMN